MSPVTVEAARKIEQPVGLHAETEGKGATARTVICRFERSS